jgi:signal transduction histidine kinase
MNQPTNPPALSLLLVSALLFVALGWLFSVPVNTPYQDLVQERSYFEDASGTVTIANIGDQTFTPFMGPLFRGNNSDPVWLKLTLGPSSQPNWVVMVQPNYTHHVEVYLPAVQGAWVQKTTGSKHAFSEREVDTLAPSVRYQPSATDSTVIYIKAVTPTTPIYARVISETDSVLFDSRLQMVGGAFAGIGFLVAMISLMVYTATRDSLWLLDAVYNLSGLCVLALLLGLASRFVWPDRDNWVNQSMVLANLVHMAIATAVYYRIFKLFEVPRCLLWHAYLTWALVPLLVWMTFAGHADKSLAVNNALILFANFFGVLIAVFAKHKDKFLLYSLRFAYFVLTAFTVWWVIPLVLKLQTENFSALYPNMPLALFSLFMLILLLVRNTQLKIQEGVRTEIEKRQVEYELQLARKRHEESSSFYGMLMHEVKTPLSTIRMAVSNLENALADQDEVVLRRLKRVQNSVDNVDEVLKRGVDVDILEQGALAPDIAQVNVGALVQEVCRSHPEESRLKCTLPDLLMAKVDRHLLGLMLMNLIDNAVKYSPENTEIPVILQQTGDSNWELSVRNQVGFVGFPDDAQVFSKYYRAELAISKSGMGLGLYWVRGVARRMGGDALYQRDQQWVVFKICLPI